MPPDSLAELKRLCRKLGIGGAALHRLSGVKRSTCYDLLKHDSAQSRNIEKALAAIRRVNGGSK